MFSSLNSVRRNSLNNSRPSEKYSKYIQLFSVRLVESSVIFLGGGGGYTTST